MKKNFLIAALISLITFSLASCEDNSSALSIDNQNLTETTSKDAKALPKTTLGDVAVPVKVEIKFKAKLHRGRKWSKKHNVEPCTSSFGLCEVKVEIDLTVKKNVSLSKKSVLSNDLSVFRIKFLKPVKATPGDIFMSSEGDGFTFPVEVSKYFRYNEITIMPKNYIYQPSNKEYPYGYVDVVCITK